MARHTITRLLVLCGCLLAVAQSRTVSRIGDVDIESYNTDEDEDTKKPFSLREIYYHIYHMQGFNGSWISDTEVLLPNILTGDVNVYNVKSRENKQIFDGWTLPIPYKYNTISLSADRKYMLFGYNARAIFRHSTVRNYLLYDTKSGAFHKIANEAFIALAVWSPSGNNLVYVLDNDIYYMTVDQGQNNVRRLTKTGIPEIIYNGVPDWVYEEEVLSSATALWYSPDGRYVAYGTFNDTNVKDMAFPYYGAPGSLEDQYPSEIKIKYPKVGTPNPEVSLSIIDLNDPLSEPVILKAPVRVVGSDNILFTVSWWDQTHVLATWTNRVQNRSQMVMYDTQGASHAVLDDEETNGWVQPSRPIRVDDYVLFLRWADSGTKAGKFQHIVRYKYDASKFVSPLDLTPGPSEVQSIQAVDPRRNGIRRIYYLATAPGEPNQKNLYSVSLDGEKPTCISCEEVTPEGNKCTYVSASFSRRNSYYALTCFGPDPVTTVIKDAENQQILIWETNWLVRKVLTHRLMPQLRDFNVTVNGYDSRVRLMLPPDFDEKKSYPLLVYVYGGPNTVRISDSFKIDYEHYMTTNRSVIYAFIDARGSAYKGSKMLHEIYRKIGTVEVEDTIAVTAALQKRYSWIDGKRTGVWGWSYGGFTSSMILTTDTDSVFKCAIAVAPVTSWIYYDSIYTERFMGIPTAEDNLAGYNRTDISRRSEGIRGKKYMLIHGTGDDNVHYQQAMALVKALEMRDILFEQVTYTDEAHGLQHVSPHLYHTMDKFWSECFNLDRTE